MTGAKRKRRRRCPRPSDVEGFYDLAVPQGDRIALTVAHEVEGLDQEIAVLRVRLRRALEEHPENMTLMLKGVEMLVKAVSAGYRLSKDAKADLSESVRGTLEEYARMISPEGESDFAGTED
ncbi:MAG: hypothetical protein ABSC13_02750 [Dehalococcoidia bacterium]